jgi:Asp-tRNA(Asn)/Glu-tRNA(Gln) amidotransferase A subunit family amidase
VPLDAKNTYQAGGWGPKASEQGLKPVGTGAMSQTGSSRQPPAASPRIGWFEDDGRTPVASAIREAVRRAADALSSAGFEVVPFRPEGLDEARELWWEIFGRASRLLLEPLVAGHESEVHPNLLEFLDWTRRMPKLTAERLLDVEIARDLLRTRFLQQMEDFPVLLCPVSAVAAFRHGERTWPIDTREVHYLDAWSYSAWFNLLQNPAVSVPAGLTAEGLPVGVQVVTRHWEELTALRVAKKIESALGGYHEPDAVRAGGWGLKARACRAEASEPPGSSIQPPSSGRGART